MSNNELIDKIIEGLDNQYETNTDHWHQSYHWDYITKDKLEDFLESFKTK